MTEVRTVIIAKAPIPGMVKTRLIPVLGPEGAAALARQMLVRTISEAIAARIGPVEICGAPDPSDPAWGELLADTSLLRSAQGSGDLGERLAKAAQAALTQGYPVLLIGSDCPALDRDRLRALAAQLQNHDAVIQPAVDGGYAALGLRRFDTSVFAGIRWSTEHVAAETRRKIAALGWTCHVATPALRDLDTPEDLAVVKLDF